MLMSNISSTLKSAWKQENLSWLFQIMVVFGLTSSLIILGCGSDDEENGDVPVAEQTLIVDGREVVVLQGKITEDRTLSADYDYLLRGAVFVEDGASTLR